MKKKKRVIKKKRQRKEQPAIEKKELDYIPLGKCRSCKKIVKDTDLASDLDALNKFASSGLCKKCLSEEVETADQEDEQMREV